MRVLSQARQCNDQPLRTLSFCVCVRVACCVLVLQAQARDKRLATDLWAASCHAVGWNDDEGRDGRNES